MEESECVASLVARCDNLIQKISYSDQDARLSVLTAVRSNAYACQMVLNLLHYLAIDDEMLQTDILKLLGIQAVNEKSVESVGKKLHKTSKLALVILAQFQIENCLRSLARELSITVKNHGFFRVAKALLNDLALSQDRILDILNTPALIRNSLHANGIHHGYSDKGTVVEIEGVTYKFVHEEAVHCASVAHIAHALEASVGVLDEIFHTKKIFELPDPIMDQYVWDIATTPDKANDV